MRQSILLLLILITLELALAETIEQFQIIREEVRDKEI